MVKITLEFPTVDLAIVALGKLVPAGAVKEAPQVPVAAAVAPAGATTARKGRSDKGIPRKQATPPEKDKVAMVQAEMKAAAPQADGGISVADTQAGVRKAPAVPAAPATLDAAQAALTELFNKKGASTAMDLLARYGKSRLSEVPAEDRQRLIDEVKELLDG